MTSFVKRNRELVVISKSVQELKFDVCVGDRIVLFDGQENIIGKVESTLLDKFSVTIFNIGSSKQIAEGNLYEIGIEYVFCIIK